MRTYINKNNLFLARKIENYSQIIFEAEALIIFKFAGKFVSFQARLKYVVLKLPHLFTKRFFAHRVALKSSFECSFER